MEIKYEPLYVINETSERVDAKTGEVNYVGSFEITNAQKSSENTKIIAYIHPYGPKKWPNKNEAEAYARLFAAAPELLESAIRLVDDLMSTEDQQWPREANTLKEIINKIQNG